MIKLIKSTFYKEHATARSLYKFLLSAKQLSFGPHCERFEQNFAKYQGQKHAVFVNSGSAANLALIQTLLNLNKIKRGDNVGFSALTWSTNVMPLIQLGLNAIPVDVELATLNVSSKTLLGVIKTYPIKMLFLTNLLGFCSDIDRIRDICHEKKIILIEDTCESLGTIYKGQKLGNFGVASTFSFYVGHHMSTIEGGAVTTNDGETATMLKIVRAHGWDRNLNFAKQSEMRSKFNINSTFYSRYTFYDLGFNLRPTEVNGFIGNEQIQYIDEITRKRRDNFMKLAIPIYRRDDLYYSIRFEHIDFISNFAVPIVCRSQAIRDRLVKKCKNRIEIRPIVGGDITRQPFYQKHMVKFIDTFKNTNAKLAHEQGLYLCNNPELTDREIKEMVEVFTK